MKQHIRIVSAVIVIMLGVWTGQAQQVALKTNVLMLGGATPNLACEIVTGEHSSVDLSLFGHWTLYSMNSRLMGFQPEFRYWFNGRPMVREYIGIAALVVTYDMTLGKNVYDGDAAGVGFSGGYCFIWGKRLNLECYGGFGLVVFRQKQYYKQDHYDDYFPDGIIRPNAHGYKLLPIKLGVSLSYIIK